jgi:hypothetical protein
MKVVLKVLRPKETMVDIHLEFDSQEEKDFVNSKILSKNNALNRYIFDEVCKSGPLGREIYSKLYSDRWYVLRLGFTASEYHALHIDYDVISKQSFDDVSRVIARAFAKVITDIINDSNEDESMYKADPVYDYVETVDEITLPENVIHELERRGVDPTYECVVLIRTDKDSKYIFVESDKTYSQDIALISRDIDGDCNTGFNFYILRYSDISFVPTSVAIIPPAPYSDYCEDCHEFSESFMDKDQVSINVEGVNVRKYISQIRNVVLEDIQRIRNSNVLNLFVAAAYNKVYGKTYDRYGDTLSYSNTIRLPYGEIEVAIKRRWLLSPARLELRLSLFDSDYRNVPSRTKKDTSNVKFVFDYEGKDVRRTAEFSRCSIPKGECYTVDIFPPHRILPLESKDLVYSRYKTILMGDFSVVDEVIETDKQLIHSIEQQIKNNPPYLIEEDILSQKEHIRWKNIPEIESVASIYDFMTQEQKEKFITYLVAQKLKKSVEAG